MKLKYSTGFFNELFGFVGIIFIVSGILLILISIFSITDNIAEVLFNTFCSALLIIIGIYMYRFSVSSIILNEQEVIIKNIFGVQKNVLWNDILNFSETPDPYYSFFSWIHINTKKYSFIILSFGMDSYGGFITDFYNECVKNRKSE